MSAPKIVVSLFTGLLHTVAILGRRPADLFFSVRLRPEVLFYAQAQGFVFMLPQVTDFGNTSQRYVVWFRQAQGDAGCASATVPAIPLQHERNSHQRDIPETASTAGDGDARRRRRRRRVNLGANTLVL